MQRCCAPIDSVAVRWVESSALAAELRANRRMCTHHFPTVAESLGIAGRLVLFGSHLLASLWWKYQTSFPSGDAVFPFCQDLELDVRRDRKSVV